MQYNCKKDKELQDDDKITTYPYGSNITLAKYFDDEDIPDSLEELRKYIKCLLKKINFDDVTKGKI